MVHSSQKNRLGSLYRLWGWGSNSVAALVGAGTPRQRPSFSLCLTGLQPRAQGQLHVRRLTVWRMPATCFHLESCQQTRVLEAILQIRKA